MQRLVPSDHPVCLLLLLLLLLIVGKGETRLRRRAEKLMAPGETGSLRSQGPPALPWRAKVGGSERTPAWKDCPPSRA